jgi:hypothetical protein
MPENQDAWELWIAIQTQWRVGGMGVVGLDYAEIRRWAEDLEIDLSPCMWSKIKSLEIYTLKGAGDAENDRPGADQAGQGPRDRG